MKKQTVDILFVQMFVRHLKNHIKDETSYAAAMETSSKY